MLLMDSILDMLDKYGENKQFLHKKLEDKKAIIEKSLVLKNGKINDIKNVVIDLDNKVLYYCLLR